MPSEYITEGSLGDFLGFLGALAAAATDAGINKKNKISNSIYSRKADTAYNYSSIAKMAKQLTMSFPVVCSDTITPETASMIAKAVERNNVSMIQMIVAAFHIKANSGFEALKMIHTNLDNTFSAEDLVDAVMGIKDSMNSVYGEAADILKDSNVVRSPFNYARFLEQARVDFIKNSGNFYQDSFSERSVSEYVVSNRFNGGISVLKEANDIDPDEIDKKLYNTLKQDFTHQDSKDKGTNDNVRTFLNYQKQKYDISADKENRAADLIRARREFFTKQLLDSDVRKANEVQPTLMLIPYFYMVNDVQHEDTFVAGVKSRLITTTSEEIITNIAEFKKNDINYLNFIKATSGETSFAKDFLTAIQQAKIDAKRNTSKLSKTSPLWRTLQARAAASGVKRLARIKGSKNAAAAITTLVITSQEADYVAENYGIDITNPMVAREFMEHFNLLCLIIVDEQSEIAKFFYDGEKYFTDYSFNTLERDNNSANDTKKLISLLNKSR